MLKLRMINGSDTSDYFDLPFYRAKIYNYDNTVTGFNSTTNNRVKLYEPTIPFNQVIPNIPSYDELTSSISRTYYWEGDTKLTLKVNFYKCSTDITEKTGVKEVVIECYINYNKRFSYFNGVIGCATPKPIAYNSGNVASSFGESSVLIYDPINEITGVIKTDKFLISNVNVNKTSFTYRNCSGYPQQYEKNDEVVYTSKHDLNGNEFTKKTYSWEELLSVLNQYVNSGLQGALEQRDTSGIMPTLYSRIKEYAPKYPDGDDDDDFPNPDKDDDSDDVNPNPHFPTAATGFVSLYSPTPTQLKSLAAYMWSKDFLDLFVKLFENPYDSIISIKNVCSDFSTGGSTNIILGNVDTGIKANEIVEPYQQIDCGTINLTRYFGNFLDFNPYTSIKIYLPFIGFRELDVDEVMGASLHLYYNIDLLTGSCVALINVKKNISGTNLNSVLYQFDGMIASEIPITGADYSQVVSAVIRGVASVGASIGITAATGGTGAPVGGALLGSAVASETATALGTAVAVNSAIDMVSSKINVQHGGSLGGSMGALATKQPYIIIHRVIPKNPSNYAKLHGIPSNSYKTLSSLKGFTKMQDIQIKSTIGSVDETEEIKQLLLEGVVI